MRIIYYSPHPTHDLVSEVGYSTHQRETILALQRLGAEVLPLVMGGTQVSELRYTSGKAVEHKGFKFYLKKILPRFLWVSIKDYLLMRHDKMAASKLEEAILTFKPDLVYERSEYLQDSSVDVVQKHGIKYFAEVNAPFVEEMLSLEGSSVWISLAHKKEERKYRQADKIFVVSSALKTFLSERYHVDTQKIIVSPNRIDPQMFLKDNSGDPLVLPDLTNKGIIIGFVGSILPHHYVDLLIKAFNQVLKSGRKACLMIVGEGALLEQLKQEVRRSGIEDSVVFTGNIKHRFVHRFLELTDICVMPGSNWYGSPIKIFEYAILGKAIVAPDNGPLRDVMENGKDGLLVATDQDSIAEALNRLIDSEELRIQLGNNFRSKVLEQYTWKTAAEEILLAFQNT